MEESRSETSNLERWFKLTFRLIIGDHWQEVAPLVVNGDTTYRWCREMILNSLRELQSTSNQLLSSAISNVKDEIWKLRSTKYKEGETLSCGRVWENTSTMAFELIRHIPEVDGKLTALKLAIVARAFECKDKDQFSSLKIKISVAFSTLKGMSNSAEAEQDILEVCDIFAEYLEESGIDTTESEKAPMRERNTRKGGCGSWKQPESWCFGDFGNDNGQLEYPVDVLVNARGEFVVLEENSRGKDTIQRIQIFDKNGRYISTLLQRGKDGISSMSDMALDNGGNVVVSLKDEKGVGGVNVYNTQGTCVREVEVIVLNPQFPPFFTCVAVDHINRILVVEHNEMSIHVYGNDGKFLFKFGKSDHNAKDGRFDNIYSLNCSQSDEIYVCDPFQRVQVFDNNGAFLRSFKPCGTVPSSLIVMDTEELVYGINRDAHALKVYSLDGTKVLRKFGGFGNELGKLWSPMGIAMTPNGKVAVAERESHRIQVIKV